MAQPEKCEICEKKLLLLTDKEAEEARKTCKYLSQWGFYVLQHREMDVRGLKGVGELYFCSLDCLQKWLVETKKSWLADAAESLERKRIRELKNRINLVLETAKPILSDDQYKKLVEILRSSR